MWRFRRDLLGVCVMLTALALSGCAQPDSAPVTTAEAPDLSGVAFDVHQEPG